MPFPSPRDLSDPEIEPRSPALQADSLPSESLKSHLNHTYIHVYVSVSLIYMAYIYTQTYLDTHMCICMCIYISKYVCAYFYYILISA